MTGYGGLRRVLIGHDGRGRTWRVPDAARSPMAVGRPDAAPARCTKPPSGRAPPAVGGREDAVPDRDADPPESGVVLSRTGGGSLMATPSRAGCAGSGTANSAGRLAGFAGWGDGWRAEGGAGWASAADPQWRATKPDPAGRLGAEAAVSPTVGLATVSNHHRTSSLGWDGSSQQG
jgi:hypothetical protein